LIGGVSQSFTSKILSISPVGIERIYNILSITNRSTKLIFDRYVALQSLELARIFGFPLFIGMTTAGYYYNMTFVQLK